MQTVLVNQKQNDKGDQETQGQMPKTLTQSFSMKLKL